MPDDLEAIFAEVEAEGVQVDEPVAESTDVTDGEPDIDLDDVDIDTDDNDNSDEIVGKDDGSENQWNWSDYADRLVPWERNGESHHVTLKELREGYMRQQDYTAKTQEIAEARRAAQWAEEVRDAFDRDPQGTLEAFARAYGLLGDDGFQEQRGPGLDELDEDIRPWAEKATYAEQQLQIMEQRMAQLETERLKSEIKMELDHLASRFGDSFDKVEVLQLAAQKNLPLEDAYYRLLGERQFQQSQSQSKAEREAAEAAEREQRKAEQARQSRKKSASGTTKGSFKASDIPADDFDDIGELFEQLLAGS